MSEKDFLTVADVCARLGVDCPNRAAAVQHRQAAREEDRGQIHYHARRFETVYRRGIMVEIPRTAARARD